MKIRRRRRLRLAKKKSVIALDPPLWVLKKNYEIKLNLFSKYLQIYKENYDR